MVNYNCGYTGCKWITLLIIILFDHNKKVDEHMMTRTPLDTPLTQQRMNGKKIINNYNNNTTNNK